MIHLWQIFGGNVFLVFFWQFCTSQKWNYQIWIKIEQNLGHYFSEFLKSLIVFYSCIVQWLISIVPWTFTIAFFFGLYLYPLQCKRSKEQRDALLKRLWGGIYIAGGCATRQNAHFSYFLYLKSFFVILYKEGRVVKRIEESNWSNQPQQWKQSERPKHS